MKNITVYSGPLCNFCDAAKRLLARNNLAYKEIDISSREDIRQKMIKLSNGLKTVPQIFISKKHIGGFAELNKILLNGKLI